MQKSRKLHAIQEIIESAVQDDRRKNAVDSSAAFLPALRQSANWEHFLGF